MRVNTYKSAGVDVEAGYDAVRLYKDLAARTCGEGVLAGIGGFGSLYELPKGYAEPVLVSGADGVGTKLRLAFMMKKHDTVGIDCVAMCVNDIICQGATPLYFLDYLSMGLLEPVLAAEVVKGVAEGCVQAGCALTGGETAEMPGFYPPGEYDLAGFAVGVCEKARLIDGSRVRAGDALVGLASSGLHSNGFSLVRKVCFETQKLNPRLPLPKRIHEKSVTLGEELLKPTRIYAKTMASLRERFDIKGAAHITGGGWKENIPRLFGAQTNLAASVSARKVNKPNIFRLLQEWGGIPDEEMYATFNMGVGLVLAVAPEDAPEVIAAAFDAFPLGVVTERGAGCGNITIEY
jgi:phosphoribosylformylglycinamidine cyclo-ligase